jgi:MGT family glycosyltransferase
LARFLVGTLPVIGHINPILPIVKELVARGHEVRWYTGEQFRIKVDLSGATWCRMKRAVSYYGTHGMDAFPERMALQGVDRVVWDIENVFIPDAAKQADDLLDILEEFPADAILCDTMFFGARFLHEKHNGPPWAVFNITVLSMPDTDGDAPPLGLGIQPGEGVGARLVNRGLHWISEKVLFRRLHEKYREARVAYGLPAGTDSLTQSVVSPFLWLQGTAPSFEYPIRDLPPQVHFVGAILPPDASFAWPALHKEIEEKKCPVILVTQGTISVDANDLIKPVCTALANENVLVVATTAGAPVNMAVPENVRLASFLPYSQVLPHVDVLVTNGSYGTVQHALTYGVPMVAHGETEDKMEVCARIEWSGTGIRLKGATLKETAIRKAVKKVLTDPSYKAAAERIQFDLKQYDGPKVSASLLEELARTGEPVC